MNLLRQLFANPWAFVLVIPLLALVVLAILTSRRRKRALGLLGSLPAVQVLVHRQGNGRIIATVCVAAGLVLLVIGIAGPQWGRADSESARPGRDVVVVLDASWSMFAETPSRFKRARDGLIDLATVLRKRGGHRIALVVFAGRAKVLCPLTHDYDFFQEIVEQLDSSRPLAGLAPDKNAPSGTRIGEGLTLAVQMHTSDPGLRGYQDIILISDGDDPAQDDEWNAGVVEAHERGMPVYTVGVGDPRKSSPILIKPDASSAAPADERYLFLDGQQVLTKLEEMPLKEIARLTDGSYYPAQTQPLPLGDLFRNRIENRPGHEGDSVSLPRQRSAWFFAGALAFFAAAVWWRSGGRAERGLRIEDRGSRIADRILHPPSSILHPLRTLLAILGLTLVSADPAAVSDDLVRQGNAAFASGERDKALNLYQRAENRTDDPGLVAFNKATTFYQLGRYAEAARHYQMSLEDAIGERKARALYGLGNSLVRRSAGSDVKALKQAIRSYNQCLDLHDLEESVKNDASENLKIAEVLLQQAIAREREDHPDNPNGANPGSNKTENGSQDANGSSGRQGAGDKKASPGTQAQEIPGQTDPSQDASGSGLVPIPDTEELVRMPPEDAAAHLRLAASRILRDQEKQRSAGAPVAGVKDW